MFKSAQVLASTTLLCGVLALSGCGASQAGQDAEDTSAHPSASASVKPGTISVASESPSASVAPGSITVVNSGSPEHGDSSSAHAEESSSENHESKHEHSSSSSSEAKHEDLPPENSESNNGEERNDSDSGNRQGSSSDSGSSSSNSSSSNSSGGNSNGNNNGSSSRSDNSGQKNAEGPSQCSMDDLNVSVSVTDNSPGARTLTLYFQNSSDSPCSLRGYPRVIYADSSGNWVGREASNSSEFMNPAGVTIAPGDSTTVVMRSINTNRFGDNCGARQVEGFLVGLAGDRDGVTVPFDTTACSSSVPQLSVGQFGAR
ncbi:DUF4232 domain-containing protein [Rothia sp. HMSC068F09]|uniref:DUF4232 domain-containing protein n=1 Tax=Rothia sp. HMSC068F09 TaxID=1739378 RepID=UPI0008A44C05|nr:DUF4232 domain-containing protein [Rothia sp. HMSC068F09]OFR67188.1 peptide ABC transporter permease [Rothia sp. HMSC068F09]